VRHNSGRRSRAARSWAARLTLGAALGALCACAPLAVNDLAGATTTKKFSCPSAASVNSALGTTVSAPKSTVRGTVTVCTYSQGANSQQVLIRLQTGMTPALRTASRAGFDQHGEPTVTVTGLGDAAFSSTIGTGQYADNTIVVEKGTKELLVTALAPLASVQSLAASLLSKI
jgi:hypothetical protein